jgi:hypothetical protein
MACTVVGRFPVGVYLGRHAVCASHGCPWCVALRAVRYADRVVVQLNRELGGVALLGHGRQADG